MKKTLALLLCLTLILPLASCVRDTPPPEPATSATEPSDTPTDTAPPNVSPELIESTKYYKIEKLLSSLRYTVYGSNGEIVLCEVTNRPLELSMLNENIVDLSIDLEDGITSHKYYDVKNNRFSEEYLCVIATSDNLIAYFDIIHIGKIGEERKLIVKDIFDESVFCKSFGLYFSWNSQDPVLSARFTEGEEEFEFVYLMGYPGAEQTLTVPIRNEVSSDEMLRKEEEAMAAYEAVLKNEITVYERDSSKIKYLRDCKAPDYTPLSEASDLKYAYTDMDGDGICELVLTCSGGELILRYYEGIVYAYQFIYRSHLLNTDGSYSWTYTGQNYLEYGEHQLFFDGALLRERELWRIVNEGTPNAKYYLGGARVAQAELLAYIESHPKTQITFTPLEMTTENILSPEEALEIADAYWGYVNGSRDGACGTIILNKVELTNVPNPICTYYRFAWKEEYYFNSEVEGYEDGRPYHVITYKEVLVNIFTGECVPYWPNNGK